MLVYVMAKGVQAERENSVCQNNTAEWVARVVQEVRSLDANEGSPFSPRADLALVGRALLPKNSGMTEVASTT
jgi:hypothetical protein